MYATGLLTGAPYCWGTEELVVFGLPPASPGIPQNTVWKFVFVPLTCLFPEMTESVRMYLASID